METILTTLIMLVFVLLTVRSIELMNFQQKLYDGGYGYIMHQLNQYDNDMKLSEHYGEFQKMMDDTEKLIYKYSGFRLLFSFKRLQLSKWYTPEEVIILTEYDYENEKAKSTLKLTGNA